MTEPPSSGQESTDSFLTLRHSGAAEPPKTKGSRFLGEAHPATTEAEAQAVVAATRKREHAATHHVWAYRLGPAGARARASDDGEPTGSSGPPVLREIESRGLTDCVVVVTRYYGGTKLGTGGLARAYGEAAAWALDAAPAERQTVRVPVTLSFSFADTAAAMRMVERFDAVMTAQEHSAEGSRLSLAVRASQAAPLAAAFVEATAGRGRVA